MLFKSKAKKREERSEENTIKSKNKVIQMIEDYQELEVYNYEKLGYKIDFNYPRVYLYQMCNYAEDISVLIENQRYASIYALYVNFLRSYAVCKALMKVLFNTQDKFDDFVKKFFSATLQQRMRECIDFDDEYGFSEKEEIQFFKIRTAQMGNIIERFFPTYMRDEIYVEREYMYETIDEIGKEFGTEIPFDDLVLMALKENEYLDEDKIEQGLLLWISGKSAEESNIQTVLTRILGYKENNKALMLNKHEGITENVMYIIEKALEDVIGDIKGYFEIG